MNNNNFIDHVFDHPVASFFLVAVIGDSMAKVIRSIKGNNNQVTATGEAISGTIKAIADNTLATKPVKAPVESEKSTETEESDE